MEMLTNVGIIQIYKKPIVLDSVTTTEDALTAGKYLRKR